MSYHFARYLLHEYLPSQVITEEDDDLFGFGGKLSDRICSSHFTAPKPEAKPKVEAKPEPKPEPKPEAKAPAEKKIAKKVGQHRGIYDQHHSRRSQKSQPQ